MPVWIVDEEKKLKIVQWYLRFNMPIGEIAERIGRSQSTIRRVLKEAGVDTTKQKKVTTPVDETRKIMALLYKYGVSAAQLETILNAPALTANNVANFLRKANPAQLAVILSAAGLTMTLPTIGNPTQPIPKDAQQSLFDAPE